MSYWERWLARRAFDALFWVAVNCQNSNDHNHIVGTLDILRKYMDEDAK